MFIAVGGSSSKAYLSWVRTLHSIAWAEHMGKYCTASVKLEQRYIRNVRMIYIYIYTVTISCKCGARSGLPQLQVESTLSYTYTCSFWVHFVCCYKQHPFASEPATVNWHALWRCSILQRILHCKLTTWVYCVEGLHFSALIIRGRGHSSNP